MKFNFRKIASVLTGAVMLSSTVALAAAVNYPAPFVKSGSADVAVVYGSQPGAEVDLVAVADITNNLQVALAKQTATSGSTSSSTSVSGGDFVNLAKSSDKVNLGNTISGVFGTTVDDDDLQDLLVDGTYLNDENTEYDYEQRITLTPLQMTHFADSDYKDKEPTVGFKITSGTSILNYTLDLTTDAESDVSSSDLVDFETTDVMILGKRYYILDAKNGTGATYLGKFTLLDAANTAIVTEGETSAVTVGDKSYDVAINHIDSSSTKLEINGEVTNSLNEGETFKLKDGTYIGIKDILYNSKDAGISKVEFSIGTGKLEIESTNDVELNDDSIENLKGYITKGTASSGKEKLDKITLEWRAEDDMFLTPDSELVMPGFGAVKLSMGAFFTPVKEVIKVENDGDDSIQISVPVKDGTAKFNILYANSTGEFTGIGKDSDELLRTGNSTATRIVFNATSGGDKWFVASWNSTADAESYLLSATVAGDQGNDGRNRTTIKNEVSNEDVCKDKVAGDSCDVGSVSLTIGEVFRSGNEKRVNLTGGNGVSFQNLYTKEGLRIALPFMSSSNTSTADGALNLSGTDGPGTTGHNFDSFILTLTEEDKDDTLGAGAKFNVTLNDNSDGDLEVSDINTAQSEHEIDDSDTFVSYVQSDLATAAKVFKSGDQDTAEVEYHGEESYADVFLTAVGATVSSDGSEGTTTGTGVKELGSSVMVKDTEVAQVASKNLIVVGGSCVNKLAAELLGGSYCGAEFEAKTGVGAGSFLIETFSRTGGNVATLVAGYHAQDTATAAKYLTTQTVDISAGKKYKGSSATKAELVTTTTGTTATSGSTTEAA